jgi:hypothetical protein
MTEIVTEYLFPVECLAKLLQVSNLFSDSQNRTAISLTEAGFTLKLDKFWPNTVTRIFYNRQQEACYSSSPVIWYHSLSFVILRCVYLQRG